MISSCLAQLKCNNNFIFLFDTIFEKRDQTIVLIPNIDFFCTLQDTFRLTPIVRYEAIKDKSYKELWDYQTSLHKEAIKVKLGRREDPSLTLPTNHLLLCEHNPVYTLGKSGSIDHLLLSDEQIGDSEFEFFNVNRGGDITYHGPGQITGYPIFDLDQFFNDVHKYVRYLEEVIIRTIANYRVVGGREEGYTGVWINDEKGKRKICAIGVHLSRWVSMHGFGFNVNTELSHFKNIVACGITENNMAVTSLSNELGEQVDMNEVKTLIKQNFKDLFGFEYE